MNGLTSELDLTVVKAEVGAPAPDFALTGENGAEWRLSEQRGRVVALLFYPRNETLVCTKQLCSVRNNWRDYVATKATVVGVSPGTPEEHRQFAQRHKLPLPLLADTNRRITEIYTSSPWIPTYFMRGIVVIDALGIVRTRKTMLRAFRPTDYTVLTAIYAAKSDAARAKYNAILEESRRRPKNSVF